MADLVQGARWGTYDRSDPFPVYRRALDDGAVHAVTLRDGLPAWVVVRYEEARAALNDPRFSKDMHAALASGDDIVDEGLPGPAFARHMLGVSAPDHSRLRHLAAPRFTKQALTEMEPRVRAIVDDLLDGLAGRGPDATVDLMEAFAFPMPFTVICELLGIPEEHRAPLGDDLHRILRPLETDAELADARLASDHLAATFAEIIDAKDAEPGDDLISDLVLAARDGQLDRIELQSTAFNLIVAGHETTTNLIGATVRARFVRPELAPLLADPERVGGVLEELIRHDGPVHHATFRYAAEPVELGGTTIPAGGQVLISVAAANRDERAFTAPDTVDVEREGPRHLGFGHGIHHCLGAGLARLEGAIAITELLRRFPDLRPAAPIDSLSWDRGDGIVLRGLTSLPVVLGPEAPR
jgi:cytochrome P450